MAERKLRVGVAGLGTVGGGLLKLFADPQARVNEKLELVAVSARDLVAMNAVFRVGNRVERDSAEALHHDHVRLYRGTGSASPRGRRQRAWLRGG